MNEGSWCNVERAPVALHKLEVRRCVATDKRFGETKLDAGKPRSRSNINNQRSADHRHGTRPRDAHGVKTAKRDDREAKKKEKKITAR